MAGKAILKKRLRSLLANSEMEAAGALLGELGGRKAATLLLGLIADGDVVVKFQAVSALGLVVRELAASDLETGREVLRRLVWSLNEESGAVPWGAPEAMGEIMANDRRLAEEYLNLLISYIWIDGNYLEFEPLQAGVAWGVGRVAQAFPKLVLGRGAAGPLLDHLASPDGQVRGCCAWALGLFAGRQALPALEALTGDQTACAVFQDGALIMTTVGELAADSVGLASRG